MGTRKLQPSFTGGEVAPALHYRVDLDRHGVSLATCRNMTIHATGGASNRPGTTVVNQVKDSTKATWLIPFQFSTEQAYMLELGDQYIRFFIDGAPVIERPNEAITGVDHSGSGTPVEITVTGHPYSTSDVVLVDGVRGVTGEPLNGVEYVITKVDGDTISLDGTDGDDYEGTYTAATGRTSIDYRTVTNVILVPASEVVLVSIGHGFSTADRVWVWGVGGVPGLNLREYTITKLTDDSFTLDDTDSDDFDGAFATNGEVGLIYEVASPYLEADLKYVNFTQSADVMSLARGGWAPRELTRTWHDNWTMTTVPFTRTLSKVTNLVGNLFQPAGPDTFSFQVTAVVDTGGTSIETLPATIDFVDYFIPSPYWAGYYGGGGAYRGTLTWDEYTDAREYRVYFQLASGSDWIFMGATQTPAFDVSSASGYLLYEQPEPIHQPFASMIGDNPFGEDGDPTTPGCVGLFQQRRFYGNSAAKPQTVWGSQSAAMYAMHTSTPIRDSDGITHTIAARQVNEIRHLVPMRKLLVFTSGGELRVQGDSDDLLSPDAFTLLTESWYGASFARPVVIGNTVLYVQEKGAAVRDFLYKWETEGFDGNDLTVMSRHLFDYHTVDQMAYAQVPHGIVWCIRDDGTLLGLTYLREHQVWGWHRHDTDGDFESVAAIPEGNEDAVYVVTKRLVNGSFVRFIERLHTRHFVGIEDAYFVDCGLSYDVPITASGLSAADPCVVTATAHGLSDGDLVDLASFTLDKKELAAGSGTPNGQRYKVANKTADTFELTDQYDDSDIDGTLFATYIEAGVVREAVSTVYGMTHLEGEDVAILADGNVKAQQTVPATGAITLDPPASRVHVGLPYYSDLETLDLSLTDPTDTKLGNRKRVGEVTLLLERSRGFWAGPTFDSMNEHPGRTYEDYDEPTGLITGPTELTLPGEWNRRGRVCIRQTDPLPLTVLGILPDVEVGGA